MDKEELKEKIEKIKQIAKVKLNQAIEYTKKNYPQWRDKAKEYTKVVVLYTKKGYSYLKVKAKEIAKYLKENYPYFKEKTIKFAEFLKQKSILLYKKMKANPKQSIIACSILLVAIIVLILGLSNSPKEKVVIPDISLNDIRYIEDVDTTKASSTVTLEKSKLPAKPTNVVFNFTATITKPIVFEVFYTVKREIWFDKEHSVLLKGIKGTNEYSVVLPSDKIYRIRLDFGSNPGKVKVKNLYLSGTQEFDLNNFSRYELNQLENVVIKKDGGLSFTSSGNDPYIAYHPRLIR